MRAYVAITLGVCPFTCAFLLPSLKSEGPIYSGVYIHASVYPLQFLLETIQQICSDICQIFGTRLEANKLSKLTCQITIQFAHFLFNFTTVNVI